MIVSVNSVFKKLSGVCDLMNELTGNKVLIRNLTVDDIASHYVRWMNDPQVNMFMESRFVTHTVDSLVSQFNKFVDNGDQFYAIIEQSSALHIGNLKIGPINSIHQHAEIGVMIGDSSCWGLGYASEAISLATEKTFRDGLVCRLTCGSYKSNVGSIAAFLKAGYKVEGIRIGHVVYLDEREDCVVMGRNNF